MDYEFKGNTVARTLREERPGRPVQAVAPDPGMERVGGRTPAQVLAGVFGLVFLLVGMAGFIPGITSNFDDLALLGTDSRAELLGLFRVSVVHNLVHVLFGVGLLAAARDTWSKAYLLGGGAAYLAVAGYGLAIDLTSDANFLPVNDADNLLHVGLSLAQLGAGVVAVLAGRRRS